MWWRMAGWKSSASMRLVGYRVRLSRYDPAVYLSCCLPRPPLNANHACPQMLEEHHEDPEGAVNSMSCFGWRRGTRPKADPVKPGPLSCACLVISRGCGGDRPLIRTIHVADVPGTVPCNRWLPYGTAGAQHDLRNCAQISLGTSHLKLTFPFPSMARKRASVAVFLWALGAHCNAWASNARAG